LRNLKNTKRKSAEKEGNFLAKAG